MTTMAMTASDDPTAAEHNGRIPGNKGIWVGITCEFVEFVVLFVIYFVARAHFPESFEQGAEKLSRISGTVITLLMVWVQMVCLVGES